MKQFSTDNLTRKNVFTGFEAGIKDGMKHGASTERVAIINDLMLYQSYLEARNVQNKLAERIQGINESIELIKLREVDETT